MFTPVPGVAAAPPAFGLVASAVDPPAVDRWEDGVAWVPERCASSYQLLPRCSAPTDPYTPGRAGAVYYQPVPVRIADECTTLGGRIDSERVRRVAEAQTPFLVARELWDGALTQSDPYMVDGEERTNAFLASDAATVVGDEAAAPLQALGRLEQVALEATHGQPVMLHVPVAVAWQVAPSLSRIGQQLLTPAGNIVVADGAYTGSGPDGEEPGDTVWAYATPPVAVWLSPLRVLDADSEVVDRTTNIRTVWTERVFAATWDPCAHFATEITL